jgi:outer membrane protein assembly factor BamA
LKLLLYILALFCFTPSAFSQNASSKKQLHIFYTGSIDTKAKLPRNKTYSSEEELEKIKSEILNTLYKYSYLTASIDSSKSDSALLTLYVNTGNKFKTAYLKNNNINEEAINKARFKEKVFFNKPFKTQQIQKLFEDVIYYYENNGYPFASIRLDSIKIENNLISGKITANKGQQYFIDSLIIKGNAKISKKYLENYLGVKEGDLYNELQIKNITRKLKELTFLEEKQPFAIEFSKKFSSIYLYINKKKASRFNGVIGVLPDAEGKINISGDARLQLQNPFGKGEQIDLNWRRLQLGTQDLKTKINYPFLFNTPFGTELDFRLYKRDTSFLEVNTNFALKYLMSGNNFVKVFISNKSSSILSKTLALNTQQTNSFGDIKLLAYGLGINLEKLDYRYNPTRGYRFLGNASVGNKKIIKKPNLQSEAYQTLVLKSLQYQLEFEGEFFVPISKRNIIKLGNKSASIFNNALLENELFRIGGLLILRGFDEESIFSSYYSVSTLEYRFILEQNSYFHVFTDLAYYEKDTYRYFDNDTPYSIGTGISFDTKAGIFSLSYALGSEKGNPIILRSAKVHFGFVNYF